MVEACSGGTPACKASTTEISITLDQLLVPLLQISLGLSNMDSFLIFDN